MEKFNFQYEILQNTPQNNITDFHIIATYQSFAIGPYIPDRTFINLFYVPLSCPFKEGSSCLGSDGSVGPLVRDS